MGTHAGTPPAGGGGGMGSFRMGVRGTLNDAGGSSMSAEWFGAEQRGE